MYIFDNKYDAPGENWWPIHLYRSEYYKRNSEFDRLKVYQASKLYRILFSSAFDGEVWLTIGENLEGKKFIEIISHTKEEFLISISEKDFCNLELKLLLLQAWKIKPIKSSDWGLLDGLAYFFELSYKGKYRFVGFPYSVEFTLPLKRNLYLLKCFLNLYKKYLQKKDLEAINIFNEIGSTYMVELKKYFSSD